MASIHFTRNAAIGVVGLIALVLLSSCSAGNTQQALPSFSTDGVSLAHRYNGVADLASISSAVVVVTPTGGGTTRPLPALPGVEESPAPVEYVTMTVVRVVSGSLGDGSRSAAKTIDIVSPGIDQNTGKLALLTGGPYLLFITPAMLAPGKALGGYVVSGGPNGVFGVTDTRNPDVFRSAFRVENASLPESIDVRNSASEIPAITHSEAELIQIGPQ